MKLSNSAFRSAVLATIPFFCAPMVTGQDANEPARDQVISVHFRGGDLEDYVEAIRAAGDKVNIALSPDASAVRVPEIELIDADVHAALDAVSEIVHQDWAVSVKAKRSQFGQPVFAVSVRSRRSPEQLRVEQHVQVFSLRNLTDSLPGDPSNLTVSAETILTAIETGLGISAEHLEQVRGLKGEKAFMRYHEDSGLLFVRGRIEHTELVQSILLRMERDLTRHREAVAIFGDESEEESGGPAKKTAKRVK